MGKFYVIEYKVKDDAFIRPIIDRFRVHRLGTHDGEGERFSGISYLEQTTEYYVVKFEVPFGNGEYLDADLCREALKRLRELGLVRVLPYENGGNCNITYDSKRNRKTTKFGTDVIKACSLCKRSSTCRAKRLDDCYFENANPEQYILIGGDELVWV